MLNIAKAIKETKANFKDDGLAARIGILIFVIYIYIQRWLELYPQLRYLEIAIISSALLLLFFDLYGRDRLTNLVTAIDLLWVPGIVIILVNLALVNANKFDYFIFASSFIFLLTAKVKLENYHLSLAFIKGGSVFYAFGTIAQFIFPESFIRFILYFTDKYNYDDINKYVNGNYYPGFGINRAILAPNFMATGIGIIITQASQNIKRLYTKVDIFLLLFIVAGLLIAGKRLLLLAAIFTALISFILLGSTQERLKRVIYSLAAMISGLVLFLILLQFGDSLPFMVRIELLIDDLIAGEATGSVSERFRLFALAWNLFLENPLFGIGWEQFRVLTVSVNPHGFHVHNLYLQLLCETGAVGFTMIMLPIIFAYLKTIQAIKNLTAKPDSGLVPWKNILVFSFYCQTIFLINSFGSDPFYNVIFLFLYFFSISIINSYMVCERSINNNILG